MTLEHCDARVEGARDPRHEDEDLGRGPLLDEVTLGRYFTPFVEGGDVSMGPGLSPVASIWMGTILHFSCGAAVAAVKVISESRHGSLPRAGAA